MSTIILKKPSKPLHWLQLYALYRTAFPASERKPFQMIRKMARLGKTDLWYIEKDGTFAGLAFTINGPDLILLDYLAISKKVRGQGVGSAALAQLMKLYEGKGFFLEIESTLEDVPNQAERERRKSFYQHCGLQELHVLVKLFGVNMELLGCRCQLTFEQYQSFYRDNYSPWAAEHIERV